MKKYFAMAAAMLLAAPMQANENDPEKNTSEFMPVQRYEEGFLTHYLNESIAKGFNNVNQEPGKYSATQTGFASAPKFGGYYMAGYYYSSKDGAHNGDGFKQKNVRLYVSGTLFNDFSYLVQFQTANQAFHMKDYWLEWKKYKEFQIKGGQFIRVFGYENPYTPFDYHDGAYSQITQKLCGQADFLVGDNGGGRDQGIQIQGDLLPVGNDQHSLLHYQFMVSNGQTINSADKNKQKDLSGTLQIQPIKGLKLAVWGWHGNFTADNGVTVGRNRYMFSAFYDANDWTFRTEYAHSVGHKTTDFDQATGKWNGTGEAQGWYASLGIPCSKVVKTWLKYDAYEDDATKNTLKTIYSVSPSIQIHKNMWFQPRLAYVHDKNLPSDNQNYMELSCEVGVRF